MLAVVGAVLGGIWYAAAALRDNLRMKQAKDGWIYYAELITKNFSSQNMAGAVGNTDLHLFLLNFPLPAGWSIGGPYGQHPVDPYGHSLTAQIQGSSTFFLGYSDSYPKPDGLRQDVCAQVSQMIRQRLYPLYTRTAMGPPAACATDLSACCVGGANNTETYFKLPARS